MRRKLAVGVSLDPGGILVNGLHEKYTNHASNAFIYP